MTIEAKKTRYLVLATKYRPQTFDDVIGQDVLVQTITNAVKQNRIANAFLLHGIRGIGKTTTARIVAKILNCNNITINENKVNACNQCSNCLAISSSRHPDIIEIDAASRTGVDDMREIIDNIYYAPTMAKYKIYIIDEVHMLSKSAFNALLKTLEEPPPHVKFIFATTEIRKIPVTIISRCQRFDLKRIEPAVLAQHLANILVKENIQSDNESLNLIVKAAEGSVRDALSLLDQAIVHSNENAINHINISLMLGLSDRFKLIDLFEQSAKGEVDSALQALHYIYDNGANIIQIFHDLLELIHTISKSKVVTAKIMPTHLTSQQYARILDLAQNLELSFLTRSWQLIINGLEEINKSPVDIIAGDMLIIKLCYMSNLPSPVKIIKEIEDSKLGCNNSLSPTKQRQEYQHISASTSHALATSPQQEVRFEEELILNNFVELVELFKKNNEILLYNYLFAEVHLIKFQQGRLELRLSNILPKDFVPKITESLQKWTKRRWIISISQIAGQDTLKEQSIKSEQNLKENFC